MRPRSKSEVLAGSALLLLLVLVVPLFVRMPLCCDVMFFDACARTLLRGQLLYKEILLLSPPTLDLWHAAVRAVVGWSMEGLRCADVLIVMAITALLAGCLLPHAAREVRLWVAFTLLLFYSGTSEWCHGQPDTWMLLPAAGALCLRCRQAGAVVAGASRSELVRRAVLEGILWGVAFSIKPFVALPALACLAVTAALARQARCGALRRLVLDAGGLLLGGLLVGAVLVGWLAVSGNWPYYRAAASWGPGLEEYYLRAPPWGQRAQKLLSRLWPWSLVNVLAVPAALLLLVRALTAPPAEVRRQAPGLLAPALLAACYLGWLTQAHFVQHQLDYHLVPALLLGLVVLASSRWIFRWRFVRLAVLPALLLWAIAAHPLLQPGRLSAWPRCWRGGSPELRERLGSLEKSEPFLSSWEDLHRVEKVLRQRNVRDGELTCWSNSSLALYSELQLTPSNRYVMLSSWTYFMPGRAAAIEAEVRAGPQKYLVADLEENLFIPHEEAPRVRRLPRDILESYPWNQPVLFRTGRYLVFLVQRPSPSPPEAPLAAPPPARPTGPSLRAAPALLGRLAGVLLLMGLCAVGPGLFFVRRLRWQPAETLCASLALTYVLIYLAALLIWLLQLPATAHYALTIGCLTLSAAAWRDLARLWRQASIRRLLGEFVLLLLWGALLLCAVRHFSGGPPASDWREQYERSLHFVGLPPAPDAVGPGGAASSRPPLFNLVAAHYLAQGGTDYPVFQVVGLFLSLLLYFPLSLMARRLAGRRRAPRFLLPGLLVLNPVLWWNATSSWAQAFACLYVLLAVCLYLAAWRKGDRLRMTAAFVGLAAGALVDSSAAPYGLVLGLHYLAGVFPWRKERWREAGAAGLAGAALLSTWLVVSPAVSSSPAPAGANTAAQANEVAPPRGSLARIAANEAYSAVPHLLRTLPADFERRMDLQQLSSAGRVRDHFLSLGRGNALASIGCLGGLLVVYLLVRDLRLLPGSVARFWLVFVGGSAVVGIALCPQAALSGVWNSCGQSLTYLGLAYLAARFPTLPPALRVAGLVGCALDFALGILLQLSLENIPFQVVPLADGRRAILRTGIENLSRWASINGNDKLHLHLDYLGDFVAAFASPLLWTVILVFGLTIIRLVVEAFGVPEGTDRDEKSRAAARSSPAVEASPRQTSQTAISR